LDQPSRILEIIFSKAQVFADEFSALLSDPGPWTALHDEPCWAELRAVALMHVLELACNFHRRIVMTCCSYPLRLAWLVWQDIPRANLVPQCNLASGAYGMLLCYSFYQT
jgi:hypothetical protein